jgi:hypothetical protein
MSTRLYTSSVDSHSTSSGSSSSSVSDKRQSLQYLSLPLKPRNTKMLTRSRSSNLLTYDASCTDESLPSSNDTKRLKKNQYPYAQPPIRLTPRRDPRVRELKKRAMQIESTGNAPASDHQRRVLMMVFDEITPYPDEAWISQIAIIINRYVTLT